jgi:homoserine dehydrogenase
VVAEGVLVDTTLHAGGGAGAGPTASAVVADLADLARGALAPTFTLPVERLVRIRPAHMGRHHGAYYIRLMVVDQPGVLAEVSALMRDHNVSIESLIQRARNPGEAVPIVFTTHETTEADMIDVLKRIDALDAVLEPSRMIRIETL